MLLMMISMKILPVLISLKRERTYLVQRASRTKCGSNLFVRGTLLQREKRVKKGDASIEAFADGVEWRKLKENNTRDEQDS